MKPNLNWSLLVRQSLPLAVSLAFNLAWTTQAQDFDTDSIFPTPITQTTRFGISPIIGYRFGGELQDPTTDEKYSFENGPAYGLILDYAPMDYYGRFELMWTRQNSSVDFNGDNGLGKVDINIDTLQVGGETEYGSNRFRTYVSAHIGATHFSSDGHGDETKFSFSIGTGVKAFLTKNFYLRGDLRCFGTIIDGEGSFIYANGVTVARFDGSALWQGQVSAGLGVTF